MSNKIIGNPTATPIRVDQTYNRESKNAQSGKAVAEAIQEQLGNIEVALDGIIDIQNQLMGVVE